jgi:hypothetical protein
MYEFRFRALIDEVLSDENRWHCGTSHHKKVDSHDELLVYFVNSGGIKDFARRYLQAMSATNRYYCGQFYGRRIDDPEILWNYYMEHRRSGPDDDTNGVRRPQTANC